MFKVPYDSIRKIYRLSLLPVLPYSLALATLYILIEPKTKPTFSDTTDWMALALFILGFFGVCILHACIVYQIVNSINNNANNANHNDNAFSDKKNKKDPQESIFSILLFGFRKMFPVFIMGICYASLVTLGLVAFIVPGIFLFIAGSLSMFLIVLKDTNPKEAFIESYQMLAPRWISIGMIMLGLVVLFSIVEIIANWIFTEQVVFATLFSVLIRGFLWPIAYVTMITLFSEFSTAKILGDTIEDSQDLKPSRRNRKQKFLRTAPNQ